MAKITRSFSGAAKACALVVALSAISFAQITTDQVVIGGAGAFGSNGTSNPPTLSGGYPVSGTIDYTYDQSTKQLTVVVQNTTPPTMGAFGPVITRVYLNIPQEAVSAMTLLSQSVPSGPLNWNVAIDTNVENGGNLTASSFGRFGIRLKTANGVNKAIKNPAECNVTNNSVVAGPATFVFQVAGPGACGLTAGAFSNSQSTGSNQVNAAMHFQAGGMCGELSVFASNGPECSAGGWIVGDPRPGNTLFFIETAADGCYGCLICSTDPGPTTAFGLTAPVGQPYTIVLSASFPNGTASNVQGQEVMVPNDPAFVGVTFYCAVVIVDEATQTGFDISPGFTLTILPPLN